MHRVCLIEDDAIMGEALIQRLELEGYLVDWRRGGRAGLAALLAGGVDLAIIDVNLPDITGIEVFEGLRAEIAEPPPCLFITGYGTIEDAVRLLKLGAADYLTKPLSPGALIDKLRQLVGAPITPRLGAAGNDEDTRLGVSPAMQRIDRELLRLARHADTPVLISGESGTGKEIVARRLHALQCPAAPFVAVNCAALPEGLIESELFGHEKGAFTGAIRQRAGVFEQAGQGILFLDEIGDMPLALQARLLRVAQERRVTRIGGTRALSVPARLVCATHQALDALVRAGRFREDLYYRIKVLELQLPPLRERPEDILWLAARFLDAHARRFPDERRVLREDQRQCLLRYHWPGNVRELRHVLERACILGDEDRLTLKLPDHQARDETSLKAHAHAGERAAIQAALAEHAGVITAAAAALGISRKTLWQKMRRYGIRR
ncbi:sigma-54-dependent Fis family transcriptional regulator [Thiohalocapsa marina]|uniref:Sigma-54-dependent Fis family transcriptional regulator n=1 Tax=Thiohalocapsa marina TaxID=424902 RepID=A0A5M8FCF5_9GAMM|nr:sigma-54 dependent transcriptional regulator [Thiohalocapsa marina]KAA6182377.1 sigma-54-dependent Fis family transcriptional regulator [Thiohalocapsa marina]